MTNDEINQLIREQPRPRYQVVSEDGKGRVVPAADEQAGENDSKGANDDQQRKHGE